MADAWATVGEVFNITTGVVTEAQLLTAQAVVELLVDREYADNSRISARDLKRLKKAVAYQAQWMVEGGADGTPVTAARPTKSEYFREGGITYSDAPAGQGASVSSVGMSLIGAVSPLAAAAIRRVSWMRPRTIDTLRLGHRRFDSNMDPPQKYWKPLD